MTLVRKGRLIAVTIGLVAFLWFFQLSGLLSVYPGSVMVRRLNVLFHSDTALWITLVTKDEMPWQPTFQYFVHSLQFFLWRPICRALYYSIAWQLPPEEASILAARVFVAIVAGVGVGALAYFALRMGLRISSCLLIFLMYLLFTSNTIVALPEHFGISSGLLSLAFVIPAMLSSPIAKRVTWGIMAFLTAGTTITNGLFPFAALVQSLFRSRWLKIAGAVTGILAIAVVTLVLTRISQSVYWFVCTFMNLSAVREPAHALTQAVLSLIYPVIGPEPYVRRAYPPPDPRLMVWYMPFGINQYSWIQGVGVIAWLALFSRCVREALRDSETVAHVALLGGWVLFNVVFHLIWGDEIFLYSPHWSWALMGLIVLGVRHVSPRFLIAMIIPIVIGQYQSLIMIRRAVEAITS